MLLRLRPQVRAALLERLETLFARVSTEFVYDNGAYRETVQALDLALHGREGAERSGYRPDREQLSSRDLIFTTDDAEFVRSTALAEFERVTASDRLSIDARIAFLGGDEVVEAYAIHLDRFVSSDRANYVQEMGRFAHPAIAGAMAKLATLSGAKRQAKAWLAANES